MQTELPERYRFPGRHTEAVSLLTAWVRQLKPFGRRPPILLAARLASDAIGLANQLCNRRDGGPTSATWEFHARAYLLVMLADFYSIVDAVAKTLGTKDYALMPRQLRTVCERASIRALISGRGQGPRADLYRSSLGHACHILEEKCIPS
jgi:hypothetical protein